MTVALYLRHSSCRVSIKKRISQLLKSVVNTHRVIHNQITVVTDGSTSEK